MQLYRAKKQLSSSTPAFSLFWVFEHDKIRRHIRDFVQNGLTYTDLARCWGAGFSITDLTYLSMVQEDEHMECGYRNPLAIAVMNKVVYFCLSSLDTFLYILAEKNWTYCFAVTTKLLVRYVGGGCGVTV